MCQKNSFEKNYPFQVFKISVFFLFAFFFQTYFMYLYTYFTQNLRPHLQNSFSWTIFFVFFAKLNNVRNMGKLCVNLYNATSYPPSDPI